MAARQPTGRAHARARRRRCFSGPPRRGVHRVDAGRGDTLARVSPTRGWVMPTVLERPEVAPRLRLVPLDERHAEDLLAAADPALFRHSPQGPAEWSRRGFEREIAAVRALPDVVPFAIVLAGNGGRAIGRTTFMDIKPAHRGLEIGRTWIGRAWHGTEVNPSIKYLMLSHAFESLEPTAIRVQFCTGSSNLHSQRAIEKLGARREGVLRNARILPPQEDRPEPEVRDTVVFSILAEEWPDARLRLERRIKEAQR